MDREYLQKHNLMRAHEQFMRLSEGYLSTSLLEDGDEDEQQQDQQGGGDMPQPGGDMPQPDQMGGEMPMDGQQGGDMPMNDQPGDDMPIGGEPGGLPDGPMGMDDELEPEEEDDVIDVDDITNAQEKLNKKQNMMGHDLGEVDDRIIKLLGAIESMQGVIDKNNQDILDLRAEIEKRMPTQTEKLNMQSLKAYPYNVSPKDYWKDKEGEGVYQAEYDSQEPVREKEYKVTQDEVDDYNEREIEKSFDNELKQSMKDIFKGY